MPEKNNRMKAGQVPAFSCSMASQQSGGQHITVLEDSMGDNGQAKI
ncbi:MULTISPECIES: hypothetical protein [Mesorhizobium]|nr:MULTISPECIES: hypothetical protein [Mesorhizobium]